MYVYVNPTLSEEKEDGGQQLTESYYLACKYAYAFFQNKRNNNRKKKTENEKSFLPRSAPPNLARYVNM